MSGSCIDDEILPFQLVTGMIRIHSILHVFLKIGLVTPLCLLMLVRIIFFHLKVCFFFHYQYMQDPVRALDESMWISLLSNESIFFFYYFSFFLFFSDSPKLKP